MLASIITAASGIVLTVAVVTVFSYYAQKWSLKAAERERDTEAEKLKYALEELGSTAGLAYKPEHRMLDLKEALKTLALVNSWIRDLVGKINPRRNEPERNIKKLIKDGLVEGRTADPDSLRPSARVLASGDPALIEGVEEVLREHQGLVNDMNDPLLGVAAELSEKGQQERNEVQQNLAQEVMSPQDFIDSSLQERNPKLPAMLAAARRGDWDRTVSIGDSIFGPPPAERSRRPRRSSHPEHAGQGTKQGRS